MKTFLEYKKRLNLIQTENLSEQTLNYVELVEKMITFGGKAYPTSGNVVLLAGGSGSGKSFVKDKLLGIEGFVYNIDDMKSIVTRLPKLKKRVEQETGHDMKWLSMSKNPEDHNILHTLIGDYLDLPDKRLDTFAKSVLSANPDRKPNIIFDVTLDRLTSLQYYTSVASELGYDKNKIHIVWVLNSVDVAQQQSRKRGEETGRIVPSEILVNKHRGVASTMGDILNMGKQVSKYMDGEIILAFNQANVDSKYLSRDRSDPRSRTPKEFGGKYKGGFIGEYNYVRLKQAGSAPIPVAKLEYQIKNKIRNYIPKDIDW